jgi:glycyl-tRNA synthetase alpha chain
LGVILLRSLSFQEVIFRLQKYWGDQGCVLLQPYDVEVGAGTFHPATVLRALGPNPWSACYVQPSRRPKDGRYGENPNRLHQHHQFQVILKPSPLNVQELYLDSLRALDIDPLLHDLRFVEDDWESPTLGASGLGWEVWCDGQEVTQFTYFQQIAGYELSPVSAELTYGLERLVLAIQNKENVYELDWNGATGDKAMTYGDVFLRSEREFSAYSFEFASTEMLLQHFMDSEVECIKLVDAKLALPAYDQCIKASHLFNVMDARGMVSVIERPGYIARVRHLAKACCTVYLEQL